MLRPKRIAASLCGLLAVYCSQGIATAQLYPGNNPCQQCLQPVAQTCYQTVPVTEYRPIKQMVRRPVVETKYVDQKVTAYRPITETKTASVPTVTYDNVTECKTVQRDLSHWQTNYYRNPKVSPCEYDRRPNFLGWLNRTGYSIRRSFTPNVVKRKRWVPQVVTQAVPVTRRVARHGTRQVTYNVTRMEPYTTTRKVAVNSVRYVSEEVTTMRPVTVMRTVPTGTATAFAPYGIGTATALQPLPDPIGTAGAGGVPKRTAAEDSPAKRFQRSDDSGFGEGAHLETTIPSRSRNFTIPKRTTTARPVANRPHDHRLDGYRPVDDSRRGTKFPSVIRVSRGWQPHRQSAFGPRLSRPAVSLAGIR